MAKYVETKVTTVDAVRWTGKNAAEVAEMIGLDSVVVHADGTLALAARDGQTGVNAAIGDWVVLNEHGGVAVMGDDEFAARFKRSRGPRKKPAAATSGG